MEIDETLKRIESTHKSVIGVLVCNKDGVIIRSTFSNSSNNSNGTGTGNAGQNEYSSAILQIVDKAKEALKDSDELTFVKVKTKKNEFIVVPGNFKVEFHLRIK